MYKTTNDGWLVEWDQKKKQKKLTREDIPQQSLSEELS